VEDNFRHKGLRKKLVEKLREKGITDEIVLNAINKLPRHWFLDYVFLEKAYEDVAFPIGEGQTISQPYTVAFQTQLLQINKGDKVLEVGTGSGYQTCILLEMGAKVFSIERQKKLFDKTKAFLAKTSYSPKLFYGDGYKGLPTFAPFDKILVTAGAPVVPPDLIKQLKVGGIMVIPVGGASVQTMYRIIKKNEDEIIKEEHGAFKFVPLLEDKVWKNN
jgi:protein-L-isoaspartate(D-aspartate) O-methyltransferase